MNRLELMSKYEYIINHQARFAYEKLPIYATYYISVDDLEQEGRIAFVKACTNFKEEDGIRFETLLTKYLIYAFADCIATAFRKMRLPTGGIVSLEHTNSNTPTNGNEWVHESVSAYEDPQFEEIEFEMSLQKVKSQVSDAAKAFIEWLEQGKCIGKTRGDVYEEMNSTRWRLQKVSAEILKVLYAKPSAGV